jgi:hypothetical protein
MSWTLDGAIDCCEQRSKCGGSESKFVNSHPGGGNLNARYCLRPHGTVRQMTAHQSLTSSVEPSFGCHPVGCLASDQLVVVRK